MRIKKGAVSAFLVTLATAGSLVITAPSASAVASNCSIIFSSSGGRNFVSSLCTEGVGQHRVHLTLKHFDPSVGTIPIVSDWADVGQYSTTGYPPHQIIAQWVEVR